VNTVVKERLAGEVGHPSRVSRKGGKLGLQSREGAGFPHLRTPKGSLRELRSEGIGYHGLTRLNAHVMQEHPCWADGIDHGTGETPVVDVG